MKFSLKRISKKGLVFGASAGVALGLTGAALAYWTSTGSGTGMAPTGTAPASTTLTFAQDALTNLAPGLPAQTISGTVTNTSSQSQYVASVTVAIGSVTKGPPGSTTYTALPCTAADYTLGGTTTMTVGHDVLPAGNTSFTGATIVFNDTGSNQDGCQGATVNLTYTSN